MPATLRELLNNFAVQKKFTGRGPGPLGVALVVTQHARNKGLPLDPDTLVTERGGQVAGLGGSAVQRILKKHGILKRLSREAGRTSRGSLNNMREYVEFLNDLDKRSLIDLDQIETFWIEKVHGFFAGKPFRVKLDVSQSLRTIVRDILAQAQERQKTSGGTYYAGAVLQHLVGAKLVCAIGADKVDHNSFSTADAPSGRHADFFIGDVAIHVTTSPAEAVIERCRENLNEGNRAMLVTLQKGVAAAETLSDNVGLSGRIDIFEVEQFVALNLYELGEFAARGRQTAIAELIEKYNGIIDLVEADPSLKIEIRR